MQKPTANATFSELYDRYHGRFASYCIALLGKQDGNDAFQETFVKFYHLAGRIAVENVPTMPTSIARTPALMVSVGVGIPFCRMTIHLSIGALRLRRETMINKN